MNSVISKAALTLLTSLCALAMPAAAATYPDKPIKMVIPFAPGGGSDFFGRIIAEKLGQRLGQTVIVENRGGAGGSVGTQYVANTPPDGYTIAFISNSFAVSAAVSKQGYDPVRDFTPIVRVVDTSMVVAINPSVPVNDLKGLVSYARDNPGKLSFGSSGAGGIAHLATEDFLVQAGIKMVHVPYRGTGPANTALLAGEIQVNIGDSGAVAELIKSGRIKAVAIGGRQRSSLLPDVPTSKEAGMPDLKLDIWYGLVAPRGTPPQVVERLNKEVNEVLRMPEVAEAFNKRFGTPAGGSAEDFGGNIQHDFQLWKDFVARNNIKLD